MDERKHISMVLWNSDFDDRVLFTDSYSRICTQLLFLLLSLWMSTKHERRESFIFLDLHWSWMCHNVMGMCEGEVRKNTSSVS